MSILRSKHGNSLLIEESDRNLTGLVGVIILEGEVIGERYAFPKIPHRTGWPATEGTIRSTRMIERQSISSYIQDQRDSGALKNHSQLLTALKNMAVNNRLSSVSGIRSDVPEASSADRSR